MKQLEPREVDTQPVEFPDRLPWETPEGKPAVMVLGSSGHTGKLLAWDRIHISVPGFGEVLVASVSAEVAAGDVAQMKVSFYSSTKPTLEQLQALWSQDSKVDKLAGDEKSPSGMYVVTISMPVSRLILTSAVPQEI